LIDLKEEFWETTYQQNISKMTGICYRYVVSRQIAEDLAHDAFLLAMEKSAGYKGKGCFDAWLRRITINVAVQYLRDQKKEKHIDNVTIDIADNFETDMDNENLIEKADFSKEELLFVLNDLPNHHRLVFNLYVIDNLTHIQISKELGISLGTSKSHLARARKKIKKTLYQIAEEKLNEKKGKKGLLLLIFPYKIWNIDKIYQRSFNNFEIFSKKTLPLKPGDFAKASIPNFQTSILAVKNLILPIISIGIISFAIYLWKPYEKLSPEKTDSDRFRVQNNLRENIDINETKIPKGNQTPLLQHDTVNNEVIIPTIYDSITATNSKNSVILNSNNKEQKSMKNLKKLGLMLFAASNMVVDSSSQMIDSNIKESGIYTNLSQNESKKESIKSSGIDLFQNVYNKKSQKETGTLIADKIIWSEENHEVYFKGRVKVNFGENNFDGNGSFNCMGKVYFLVIDNVPANLNTTIKLKGEKYEIARLSEEVAFKKYGDKGKMGAVEITMIKK
jgi:RNA polymerase sigma factor (sigma-70 family)